MLLFFIFHNQNAKVLVTQPIEITKSRNKLVILNRKTFSSIKLSIYSGVSTKRIAINSLLCFWPTYKFSKRKLLSTWVAIAHPENFFISLSFLIQLRGIGYKFELLLAETSFLKFSLGFSHPIFVSLPNNITSVETTRDGRQVLLLHGPNSQSLGEFCSQLQVLCKPGIYKNKGIDIVNLMKNSGGVSKYLKLKKTKN